MAFVSIDVSEMHDLASDLRHHGDEAPAQADLVVGKVAHDIVARAQQLVPVDTGYLKSTIGADVDGLSAEIGPTAEYGGYVELGTSEMSPQPYLAPAFDQGVGQLEDAFEHIADRSMA